jgi:F-type H+-transporting ATPase subunit delta
MNQHEQVRHETVLDDTTRHVARVYAEALYNAADKVGEAGEVLEELDALVGQVFGRDPGAEVFLASPSVSRDRKREALRKAFEGRASQVLVNFLYVLNDHDRLELLRAAARAYRELYDQRSGRLPVHVSSAVPLAEEQQERLRNELRQVFGREPVLQTRVDPELLGGLVVRVEDWVYDASVRTRLETIEKQLIERSSHEIQGGRDRFRSFG